MFDSPSLQVMLDSLSLQVMLDNPLQILSLTIGEATCSDIISKWRCLIIALLKI